LLRNARGSDIGRGGEPADQVDTVEHFFVMVGQLWDSAYIGRLLVRLTLNDGRVVECVPMGPASDLARSEELDDTGYVRWLDVGETRIDLADVRLVSVERPA
jgi:hypothetical protein